MKNMKFLVAIMLLMSCFVCKGQIGRLALSPLQVNKQSIGLTDIILTYSRPSTRGRKIFGELVPFNSPWRTGANRNTTIEFSQDFVFAGKEIEAGKYALFTIPTLDKWEVILYKDTDNWDVPSPIDSSKIVARSTFEVVHEERFREVLAINFGDFTNYYFTLEIAWEKTSVTIPFDLTTRALMDQKIADNLSGPDYVDFYLAATYQMESGHEFEKGLEWINKAIELTDQVGWWDYRIKTILLMDLERDKDALEFAQKGLKLAVEDDRSSIISEFEAYIKELESQK